MRRLKSNKVYRHKRIRQIYSPFKYWSMMCLICDDLFVSKMGLEKSCYKDECRKEWRKYYKARVVYRAKEKRIKERKNDKK